MKLILPNCRALFGLILLIFIGLSLNGCKEAEEKPRRSIEQPLVFIGLDGLEWSVIKRLQNEGELPNIRKLMDRGIHSGLINTGAMISPPVWTTYITGEHPRTHGVLDHTFPFDSANIKQPVDSTLRVKPALWNIASEAGLRSAIFGYFVSWPAEDINGLIVSDRARQGYPESIFPEAESEVYTKIAEDMKPKKGIYSFLSRYYPWGYQAKQASNPEHPYHNAARLVIGRADQPFLNDEFIRRSALATDSDSYDFIVVYLRSADLASHSFWREYDDTGFAKPADPELKELLGDVIPEAYRFLDEAIGDLVSKYGATANYILVSDHGFTGAGKEIVLNNKFRSVLTGNHLPVGVFIAAGPAIATQNSLPTNWRVTSMDIMPTLARLLELPIAENLTGVVLEDIFTDTFKQNRNNQKVPEYPLDGFARAYNSAERVKQDNEINSLAGLGYVGGGITAGISDQSKYDFWLAEDDLLLAHTSGEVVNALLHQRCSVTHEIMVDFLRRKPELKKFLISRVKTRIKSLSKSKYLTPPLDANELVRVFLKCLSNNYASNE